MQMAETRVSGLSTLPELRRRQGCRAGARKKTKERKGAVVEAQKKLQTILRAAGVSSLW